MVYALTITCPERSFETWYYTEFHTRLLEQPRAANPKSLKQSG